MSQKNDPTARAVEGALGLLGKSAFAAIAGAGAYVADKLKVSPEDQLRQLGTRPIWGEEIVGVACTACGVLNEEDTGICFYCGATIDATNADKNATSVTEQITSTVIKSKVADSVKKIKDQYGTES